MNNNKITQEFDNLITSIQNYKDEQKSWKYHP